MIHVLHNRIVRYVLFTFFLFIIGCSKKDVQENAAPDTIPAHALRSEQDLDVLLQAIGDDRIVLLGEASHGTSEYYNWRAALTKRLIQEKGFNFIAIEGEWADSYRINQFIKGGRKDSAQAVAALQQYDRWPTWMWANYEVASLVNWMNAYNQNKPAATKVGFYGLDVYCLWESMTELMPYLQGADPVLMQTAQQVHQCFQPFSADPQQYAYAVANASVNCKEKTEQLWQAILRATGSTTASNERQFVMQQNALVALNGERYYSAMINSYSGSWNIRDRHMMQTLKRLMEFYGPTAKAIVWEHNTHVGDARYTDMAAEGMVNVGQLVREEYGEQNVFIVGFGSYSGTVIAASAWGAPLQNMPVPPAIAGSWENILHRQGAENKIILSSELGQNAALMKPIGNRAIGVVYNPNRETGNYVPSVIPNRYDAFVFIDQTTALHPLPVQPRSEPPDTYPSGY